MRIFSVAVTYGELRSSGFPSFSNQRHEIMLAAKLEDGETAEDVVKRLRDAAKAEVIKQFPSDKKDPANPMQQEFFKP